MPPARPDDSAAAATEAPERDAHRLPGAVLPRRYQVELRPDLDAGEFSGTVTIDVEVVEPTDRIVLHALDLEIDAAEVESTSGHTAHIDAEVSVTSEPDAEQIRLDLPGELPAGTATVRLDFRGTPASMRCPRTWWLLLARSEVDLSLKDPGFPVDLVVSADLKTLTRVWMGDVPMAAALRAGSILTRLSRRTRPAPARGT